MRCSLWIHRDVEILQGFITRYAYSTRWITKDRADIHWQWNNIKKDMDNLLKEVDEHVTHQEACGQKLIQSPLIDRVCPLQPPRP